MVSCCHVHLVVCMSLNIFFINPYPSLASLQERSIKSNHEPLVLFFQVIVIVFVLCSTQALLTFIFDAVYVNQQPDWLQIYFAVVNILVIFNSAVNFIVFYLFGKKFRMLSKRVMECQMQPVHHNGSVYKKGWRKRSSCQSSTH